VCQDARMPGHFGTVVNTIRMQSSPVGTPLLTHTPSPPLIFPQNFPWPDITPNALADSH